MMNIQDSYNLFELLGRILMIIRILRKHCNIHGTANPGESPEEAS